MPLKTLNPIWLDTPVDRLGTHFVFDPLKSLQTILVTDKRVRMQTGEFMSPGSRLLREGESVPTMGFIEQYPADADGADICGRTQYKVAEFGGTVAQSDPVMGSAQDTLSGSLKKKYGLDSDGFVEIQDDGSDALDTASEFGVGGSTTSPITDKQGFAPGPITKTSAHGVDGDIFDDSRSCELSSELSESDQIGALGSGITSRRTKLEANSTLAEGPVARASSENIPVGGEGYSAPLDTALFAVTRPPKDSLGHDIPYSETEDFVAHCVIQRYPLQPWLGFIGVGTLALGAENPTTSVRIDEFGFYSPTAPDLTSLPWRMLPELSDALVAFRVMFLATDGHQYRITATEFHGFVAGTGHVITTNLDGHVFQTTALGTFNKMSIEIPDTWDTDSTPLAGDSLVITKIEQLAPDGSWQPVDSISGAVGMEGKTPLAMLLQTRLGRMWGYGPLDGSGADDDGHPTTVYTKETLVASTTLEVDEDSPECGCGDQTTGSASYEASRELDADNGLELIQNPDSSAEPGVKTITNEGTYGDRAFEPFADGAWPVGEIGVTAGASTPTSQVGTISRTTDDDVPACDLEDNPYPAPDPDPTGVGSLDLTKTDDFVADSNPLVGGALRSRFQTVPVALGEYYVKVVTDVQWGKP